MTIDWASFSPWSALAGGVLIGLASVLLLLGNGRIAGVSGILGGLLEAPGEDGSWRAAFILGLFAAAWFGHAIGAMGAAPSVYFPGTPGQWAQLAGGGLLVGFGTRLARGCTSGHGVCGLARCSGRSLVAVLVFMGVGMLTVLLTRHELAS